MQPIDCNKLTQGKEALMKVTLIQLADKASILSVTLAHCIAGGNTFAHYAPTSHATLDKLALAGDSCTSCCS